MTLLPCRELWGEAHLMYGEPPLRVVENATYVPYRLDGPWGLFDQAGAVIPESLDLKGAARTPHQSFSSCEPVTNIEPIRDIYIYCGFLNPHYGHFLINSLPKFWPYFAGHPAAKLLLASSASSMPFFAREILSSMGIDATEIVSFPESRLLNTVIVPSSSVIEQYWAYTIFRDLCRKIGQTVWNTREVNTVDRPAYLSKSRLKQGVGRFANEETIEGIVAAAGIEILHPETLSWNEQVKTFARRKCLVGPVGSAFHTSIFAPENRNIFCFAPAREYNANFALIDRLCGNNARYFYQEGLTYGQSDDFMTIVHSADVERLGHDLVDQIRSEYDW